MYRSVNTLLKRWPLVAAAAVSAVGQGYSARQERKGAEAAAEAQLQASREQTQAALDVEDKAKETARARMRAKSASKTQTILTGPLGVAEEEEQINKPSILGV